MKTYAALLLAFTAAACANGTKTVDASATKDDAAPAAQAAPVAASATKNLPVAFSDAQIIGRLLNTYGVRASSQVDLVVYDAGRVNCAIGITVPPTTCAIENGTVSLSGPDSQALLQIMTKSGITTNTAPGPGVDGFGYTALDLTCSYSGISVPQGYYCGFKVAATSVAANPSVVLSGAGLTSATLQGTGSKILISFNQGCDAPWSGNLFVNGAEFTCDNCNDPSVLRNGPWSFGLGQTMSVQSIEANLGDGSCSYRAALSN